MFFVLCRYLLILAGLGKGFLGFPPIPIPSVNVKVPFRGKSTRKNMSFTVFLCLFEFWVDFWGPKWSPPLHPHH